MIDAREHTTAARRLLAARIRRFGRDEGGTIIVMTIIFLSLMLIMGGMAVDFMRFESRRTMLQSVADRSVLAAANLGNSKDPKEVVVDYFTKAGFPDSIVGEPDVKTGNKFNSVGVTAAYDMNSIFLRLVGIDMLSAPAAATAIEGVSNIEVSLVVDISGSMRDPVVPADGSYSNQTKIEALRGAATKFVDAMLIPDYKDRISISLVPYSEQVNIGPALMGRLNMNMKHGWSHCIDFDDADFNTIGIDASRTYTQMQHFQWNPAPGGASDPATDDTVCPRQTYERIIPLSQNATLLKGEIAKLQPRAGTAIYIGLKWGLALLDKSMRVPMSTLLEESAFAGRPVDYPVDGDAFETQKVIVLMTDGQNSNSSRIRDEYYSTPSHYAHWESMNRAHFVNQPGGGAYFGNWFYQKYDNASGNFFMQQLCTSAKDNGIIIFAVAVEATTDGTDQMAKCASSSAHFFNASGDQMESIFTAIAKQITELRLSQ